MLESRQLKDSVWRKGNKMNLGENIRNLRKGHNLSQEELAEKINVSRQAVSKWESNLSYPDLDN